MATDYMPEAAVPGRGAEASPEALTAAPGLAGGTTTDPSEPPRDGDDLADDSRATIFGELQPPNINKEPFPQRLLHWKPSGKPEPQSAPVSVIVTQDVLERVNRHVSQDLRRELGGFLLGNRYVCPNSKKTYVRIDDCTEAKFASGTPVSMEMVNNTFFQLCEELSGRHRFKDVVGWYHSHPNHDVFLSPDDIRVHESRFQQDWMVALVVNPNRKLGAFFRRHDGVISRDATIDFYELLGIRSPPTKTYVPWLNYRCYDAQTGQMLSPLPAQQEEARASTRETSPTNPPWWMSLPQWLSLLRVKPVALILGALTCAVITYAALSSRGTGGRTQPDESPAKPDVPSVAQLGNQTRPSPPPDDNNTVNALPNAADGTPGDTAEGTEAPKSAPEVKAKVKGASTSAGDSARRADSKTKEKTSSAGSKESQPSTDKRTRAARQEGKRVVKTRPKPTGVQPASSTILQ